VVAIFVPRGYVPASMSRSSKAKQVYFNIGVATKVHGMVECKTCTKPRCIYSLSTLPRMSPPLPSLNHDKTTTTKAPATTEEIVAAANSHGEGQIAIRHGFVNEHM
jgi:hypothetical protein